MRNALATRPASVPATSGPRSLAQRLNYDPDQLEFVRSVIANGAPDPELEYFLRFCFSRGLDPTAKQVYYIRRNSQEGPKWTIQIGIDGYRSMAETTGEYDGQDEPTFTYDANGRLESATVNVYRKGVSRPIPGTARWSEYVQTNRDGSPNSMWSRMGHNQLAKCAEALALRKAFPKKLGGFYTNEEMGQADNPQNVTPITVEKGATKRATVANALAAQASATPVDPPAEATPPDTYGITNTMSVADVRDRMDEEAMANGVDSAELKRIVAQVTAGKPLTRKSAVMVIEQLRALGEEGARANAEAEILDDEIAE